MSLFSLQTKDINNESEQRIQWTLTESCDGDSEPKGVSSVDGARNIGCGVVDRVHLIYAYDLQSISNRLQIGNLGYAGPAIFQMKVESCAAILL